MVERILSSQRQLWLKTFEIKQLQELGRVGAQLHPDMVFDLLDLFEEKTPEQLSSLHQALERGDLREVRQIAGQLKGTTSRLGARKMLVVCRSIEKAALGSDSEYVELLLGFLDLAYERTAHALTHEVRPQLARLAA